MCDTYVDDGVVVDHDAKSDWQEEQERLNREVGDCFEDSSAEVQSTQRFAFLAPLKAFVGMLKGKFPKRKFFRQLTLGSEDTLH